MKIKIKKYKKLLFKIMENKKFIGVIVIIHIRFKRDKRKVIPIFRVLSDCYRHQQPN